MKTENIPVGTIVIANNGVFYSKTPKGFIEVVAQWRCQPNEYSNLWMDQIGIMDIPDQD